MSSGVPVALGVEIHDPVYYNEQQRSITDGEFQQATNHILILLSFCDL
jgi:hypothetical protein